MKDQRQRVRDELAELQSAGEGLAERVVSEDLDPRSVNAEYQAWYSLASRVVKQVLPDRAAEFDEYYRCTRKREGWHLTISDILSDTRKPRSGDDLDVVLGGIPTKQERFLHVFHLQRDIVSAAELALDAALADIEGVLQAGLFDDELEAAEELLKKHHRRASGVLAGVVLERHLLSVARDHDLRITKKHATVADLNEPLKQAGIYGVPTWRKVQQLADLRNLCAHDKGQEPTDQDVTELLRGVKEISRSVF